MPMIPVFIPHHSALDPEDSSVDFFCKTTENFTIKQEQYCANYYKQKEIDHKTGGALALWMIVAFIVFLVLISDTYYSINRWYFWPAFFVIPTICCFIWALVA